MTSEFPLNSKVGAGDREGGGQRGDGGGGADRLCIKLFSTLNIGMQQVLGVLLEIECSVDQRNKRASLI